MKDFFSMISHLSNCTLLQVVPKYTRHNGSKNGAGVLGLHLEGPFISKIKKGVHPDKFIVSDLNSTPTLGVMEQVYGSQFLKNTSIVTVAPELPSVLPIIEELARHHDITVSIGE